MPLISAVQRRPSQLTQELSMHFSYLPLDHFQTYFSVGLSYFYYFSDYLAWEVVNANYVQNSPTGLESYLNGTYNANPETFDIIQMYATSNIVYTPLYMKHFSRGKNIVWGDLSLVGGAGLAKLERNGNINTFDFGGMVRFFGSGNWIYRLDVRQYLFSTSEVKPNMAISFGLSYNFGETDRPVNVNEDFE